MACAIWFNAWIFGEFSRTWLGHKGNSVQTNKQYLIIAIGWKSSCKKKEKEIKSLGVFGLMWTAFALLLMQKISSNKRRPVGAFWFHMIRFYIAVVWDTSVLCLFISHVLHILFLVQCIWIAIGGNSCWCETKALKGEFSMQTNCALPLVRKVFQISCISSHPLICTEFSFWSLPPTPGTVPTSGNTTVSHQRWNSSLLACSQFR